MKNKTYTWSLAGIAVLATAITLIAWTGGPQRPDSAAQYDQDTIPSKKRSEATRQAGDRDFDRELRAIDMAKEELNGQDWEKVQREVEEAMQKIDLSKIQLDVEKAMKAVDFAKIQKEVAESMARVDFEKINSEWQDAMKKVDMEKINREIQESMSKVDWEKINAEIKESMDKVSKIDMEKMNDELRKAQKEISEMKINLEDEKFHFKDAMKKAGESIEKAKEELKGYQEMVYAMEADGLLSTKNDYTIEYKDGEISIDGKKQSSAVNEKYKKYFKKDNVRIIKEDGEINIRHRSSDSRND